MKKSLPLASLLLSTLIISACGQEEARSTGTESPAETNESSEPVEVSIGVNSEINLDIWEDVSERLEEKENITLDVVLFGDYIQNNRALQEGELDANAYQYFPFMLNYNIENDADIVPVGYTFIAPMGIYGSDQVDSIENVPEGAAVAIPNDPVTAEHALSVLELVELIELDNSGSDTQSIEDITENPLGLDFMEIEASQLPRALGDAELAVMGATHATDGGLALEEALYLQTAEATPVKYNLTFAVTRENADNEVLQTVLDEYQTEETAEFADEVSNGAYLPVWSEDETPLEDYEEFVAQQQDGNK